LLNLGVRLSLAVTSVTLNCEIRAVLALLLLNVHGKKPRRVLSDVACLT
jgi:hypothetical protein